MFSPQGGHAFDGKWDDTAVTAHTRHNQKNGEADTANSRHRIPEYSKNEAARPRSLGSPAIPITEEGDPVRPAGRTAGFAPRRRQH
jgi:hypothetical protein